jgi:hypothetical protein
MYEYLSGKSIIVYTEVYIGSGDFFAAKKLIQTIEKEAKGVTIHWILSVPKSREDVTAKKEQAIQELGENVHVMQRYSEHALKIDHIKQCDLVLMYPTAHYLKLNDYKLLKAYGAPVIQKHEYDSMPTNYNPVYKSELTCVNTGFDGLGLNFADLTKIDAPKTVANVLTAPHDLKPELQLFFGYGSSDVNSQINHASVTNYLSIALEISDPNKSVDVVLNGGTHFLTSEVALLAWTQGFSEISILTKNKEGQVQEQVKKNPVATVTERRLRLMDIFPITNEQMLALMSSAHPFMFTTGDQSLAEVLSVATLKRGVFPFYQTLYWKENLTQHWQQLAHAYLGKKSYYVKMLEMVARKKDFVVNDFVALWRDHESDILADSIKFFGKIENLNLKANSPVFLDFVFYILKNFPHQEFNPYCKLVAQLIVKVKDSDSIKAFLTTFADIPDSYQRKTLMLALTEFIRLNPVILSVADLKTIITQLSEVKLEHQSYAASSAKEILNLIPISVREQYTCQILPYLKRMSANTYPMVIKDVKDTRYIARQPNSEWLQNIVEKNMRWDEPSRRERENMMLLCVMIYPDGFGDLAKFIDVYHITQRALPGMRLQSLVYCTDEMRPTVLHLLRAAKVDMHELYLCSFSMLEFTLVQYGAGQGLMDRFLSKKHHDVQFYSHRDYALYMSVATPFPVINSEFRHYSRKDAHYIDMGEVNYASYTRGERKSMDPSHHLVSMGLDDESIGLQITEPSAHQTPDSLLANLTTDLRQKILDSKPFNEDCVLFPCYIKGDEGALSIHYLLGLMRTYYKDKQTAIMWMSELTFDARHKLLLEKFKNDGFANVVYYNPAGKREVIPVPNATGKRELRLVTGIISTKDFDLLYQLAGVTSGFSGCVGQNSFEKSMSFKLVPAFCAPSWQIPIICQAQQIVATVFDHHSAEYQLLNKFFDMLSYISNATRTMKSLLDFELLKPFTSHFTNLSFSQKLALVYEISEGKVNADLIEQHYPTLLTSDPVTLVDEFFASADIALLRAAWSKVCDYCREHRNLNTWLTNKLQEIIPDVSKLAKHRDTKGDKSVAAVFNAPHVYLSAEQHPEFYRMLTETLVLIDNRPEKYEIKFVVSKGTGFMVDVVSGMYDPTIAISMEALRVLSLSEIRFALRLCLAMMTHYPIENSELNYRDLNQEEIIKYVKDDLDFGIPYCRKLITSIKEAQKVGRVGDYKTQHYYDLGFAADFHGDLIKMIEMRLAARDKNVLLSSIFKVPEHPIPETVVGEMASLAARWRAEEVERLKQQNTIVCLKQLLEMIPTLRIKSEAEYFYLTEGCAQLLATINQLVINPGNKQHVKLLTKIIDAVHIHRVAIFTQLYESVCRKLFGGELRPLSLYKRLVEQIHVFKLSKNQLEAEARATAIHELLDSNDYAGMFINSIKRDMAYRGDTDRESIPVDTYPSSNVGARIKWAREVDDFKFGSFPAFLAWATSGDSPQTAYMLYRLGHVNTKQLWLYLPEEVLKRSFWRDSTFFGKVPEEALDERVGYGDVAPKLRGFYESYLQFRYCRDYTPIQYPVNAASLEAFILANMNTLALPQYSRRACDELIFKYFPTFLKEDRVAAEQFIWRFYCDKKFPAGIRKIAKLRKKIGLGIYDKLDENMGQQRDGVEFAPYLEFIFRNDTRYMSLTDVLTMFEKCFSIVYSHLPLDYLFRMLNLNVNKFEDVMVAVNAFRDLELTFSGYGPKSYVDSAISNTFKYAAKHVKDIQLFSKTFYAFYKDAKKSGGRHDLAETLMERLDIRNQIEKPGVIEITTAQLAKLFISFDDMLVWPNEMVRDNFSRILLKALKVEADNAIKNRALTILLFKQNPISDTKLIKVAMEMLTTLYAEKMGEDDNSFAYYRKAAISVATVFKHTPRLYTRDFLELLMNKVYGQSQLLEYITKSFDEDESVLGVLLEEKAQTYLVKTARRLAKEGASDPTVAFVTYELSRQSVLTYVGSLNDSAKRALGNRDDYRGVPDEQAAIYATSFYHNFWNQSIEARAAIINNLLMNSKQMISNSSALAAYQKALDYIIDELFPHRDEESQVCIALMHSYLNVSNDYIRPYLLSAILTANKMATGTGRSIAATLPKIAEALGAAGVKAGQAGHSYPNTPPHIREGLAYLKSRARLPYRWELWKLLKDAVPTDFTEQVDSLRTLLGGASFYIAVEVRMKNGTNRVVRLLRPNAQQEATYGFEHLRETLAACNNRLVARISGEIGSIVNEAKKGAQVEINHACALRQYQLANAIYEHAQLKLKIENKTFSVAIEPVQLFGNGVNYQIISKADGIEFNTLKTMPEYRPVCEAAAMAVYIIELENMLSGRPCDFDRHGAQARVVWEQQGPNEYFVRVINYDFGEILPDLPTEAQLHHCQQFIDMLAGNIFSMRNIISGYFGSLNVGHIASQLTQQMLTYLHINEGQCPEHDLIRLRGLFKGLLALNDYFEMIPKNIAFMLELNSLFAKYSNTTSLGSRLIGWYTGRAALPQILLPEANPNYQGRLLLAALPIGDRNDNNTVAPEPELKKLKEEEPTEADSLLSDEELEPIKKKSCSSRWW